MVQGASALRLLRVAHGTAMSVTVAWCFGRRRYVICLGSPAAVARCSKTLGYHVRAPRGGEPKCLRRPCVFQIDARGAD